VPIAVIIDWISWLESTLLIRFFSELMTFPRSGRIAWLTRFRASTGAAGRVPLDEEQLGVLGVAGLAVGELAGELRALECALPAQLPCLAGGLARVPRRHRLGDDLLRVGGVLLEELREPLVDRLLDETADPRVAELCLGLALELRVVQLHGDHGREPLAHVLALEVLLLLLDQPLLARVLVQRPRERRLEAGQVGATLGGVDVVREREDGLHVRAVPLHRDLDVAVLHLALEVDDPLVDRLLRAVHVLDEVPDAALVVELVADLALALVDEHDPEAAGQEGGLAQALDESVHRPLELVLVEDLAVGQERDDGAGVLLALGLAGHGQVGRGLPARVLLPVHLAVTPHLDLQPLGERVDDRDADPVEAAGDLVALAAELPAGVQLRHHDGEGGDALVGHDVDRDARAVVRDGDGVVRMERDLDAVGAARQGLVDRVRHDLVDEVVQPSGTGRADVHAGSEPDRLEPFEDRDVLRGVRCLCH
jgi:hypothetical protein